MLNVIQGMCSECGCQVIHEGNFAEASKFHSGVQQNYADEDLRPVCSIVMLSRYCLMGAKHGE